MDMTNEIMKRAGQLAKPVTAVERGELMKLDRGAAWVKTLESLRLFLVLETATLQVKAESFK